MKRLWLFLAVVLVAAGTLALWTDLALGASAGPCQHLGDYAEDYATLNFKFTTRTAACVPTTLAGTPVVKVYVGSATDSEIATGVTLVPDFDGVTGLNNVLIDLSADAFYAAGQDYAVVITTGTVDGVSVVGEVVATFSIENRFMRGTDSANTTKTGYTLTNLSDGNAAKLEDILDGTGGTGLKMSTLEVTGGTTLSNAGGVGLTVVSTNATSAGMTVTGNTSGAGLLVTGGATGHGLYLLGGSTSGNALHAEAQTEGDGIYALGAGTTEHGIYAQGGDTTGAGIYAEGGSTSGDGIYAAGQTLGHGMNLVAAGASRYDLNADIQGTLSGAVGSVTTKTGYALAATGADLITKTSTFALAIADATWDEVLTAATHNVATSAGRRLRQAEDVTVLSDGTAQAGTADTIQLAATESATDDWFNHCLVVLISDTGVGQARHIEDYDGDTTTATIDRDWVTNSDATTEYAIYPWSRVHVHLIDDNAITAAVVQDAAIDAAAFADNAITDAKVANDVQVDVLTIEATDATDVLQGEAEDALGAANLDHLVKSAVDTNLQTTVHDNSVIGYMLAKANVSSYVRTADSLEDLSLDLSTVLADTNELQTDWANGGRLDLILDATSLGRGPTTYIYTVTSSVDAAVIPNCLVWVTTDIVGDTVIARGYTNTLGKVTFYLDPGTYYFWRSKAGFTFTNPDTEVVP